MTQPFYSRSRTELEHQIASALSLLNDSKYFTNKDGYVFLLATDNPTLFEAITDLDFFNFQSTNKQRAIVGYHQVVLYLHRGIWTWRYHSDKVLASERCEVHHLNSQPSCNDPDNLVYVTPQQNKLCAGAVHRKYLGHVTSACIKSWGDFSNGLADTAKLIHLTIIRTFQGIGLPLKDIPKAAHILMQLPHRTGKEIVDSWYINILPTF